MPREFLIAGNISLQNKSTDFYFVSRKLGYNSLQVPELQVTKL